MDPIADMLTVIKNGYMASKADVVVPYSKFKFSVAKVLAKEKFVGEVEKIESKIKITLLYEDQKPKMAQVSKISKLGLRVYTKSKNIKKVKGGRGIVLISTPKGVMTGDEARKTNLGGEVICEVW